jgi:hypothetical protein
MHETMIMSLTKAFVSRSTEQGYKGKRRDDAALEFFLGAVVSARELGREDVAQHLEVFAALVLSVRGYRELELLSEGVAT